MIGSILAGVGVFLAVAAVRRPTVTPRDYLGAAPGSPPLRRERIRLPAGPVAGSVTGVLVGLAGPVESAPLLAGLGGLGGAMVARAVRSSQRERRARRLAQELPIVADTVALHVLAGESISTALRRFTSAARGVAAEELAAVIGHESSGFEEALRAAGRSSAHPEAGRLYDLLAHAHRVGGRLADALASLAADYRARLAAELAAEGGRRALAVYGPILALMVPTTLVFLMYPTLAGLSALSGP